VCLLGPAILTDAKNLGVLAVAILQFVPADLKEPVFSSLRCYRVGEKQSPSAAKTPQGGPPALTDTGTLGLSVFSGNGLKGRPPGSSLLVNHATGSRECQSQGMDLPPVIVPGCKLGWGALKMPMLRLRPAEHILFSSRVDMLSLLSLKSVAGIDNQAGLRSNPGVIVGRVIGYQQDQIRLLQGLRGQRG